MVRFRFEYFILCFICIFANPIWSEEWSVESPNSSLRLTVQKLDGKLLYNVSAGEHVILENSPLGLTISEETGDFSQGLEFVGTEKSAINETFAMISGKASKHSNNANEIALTFKNKGGKQITLLLRAYDDGIAYRYSLEGEGQVEITGESSGFCIPDGAKSWLQTTVGHYENPYQKYSITDVKTGDYSFPALFELSNDRWVFLTEAAVYGDSYGANHLKGPAAGRCLQIQFADGSYKSTLPLITPWRVVIIGSLADIVESTLVEDLNPECGTKDISWIKPGRVTWSWWTDGGSPHNFEKQKEFVDFASEMGWEYCLVDEGWSAEWAPELVKYANPKNVAILLWCNWNDVKDAGEQGKKLSLWKDWGVAGIKVDFMDSDSQERMKFYDSITKTAFEKTLMVSFHGATIPRGQNRRFPNIMTMEGVIGAEYRRSGDRLETPEHHCTLPFTRNVVGSMDYTPVAFSAPNRKTQLAHELALSVVFESAWQCFADSPASYKQHQAATEFLKAVPTAWDETKLISGYPGEFACIARRKGNDWFVGAISAGEARKIKIPLTFLGSDNYAARIYTDDETLKDISVAAKEVTSRDTIEIDLKENGGCAMHLKPR